MSGKGTGSRTGETKSAGAKKSGELATEAQAAKTLGVSRERLSVAIRTGLLFSFWSKGQRFVMLP